LKLRFAFTEYTVYTVYTTVGNVFIPRWRKTKCKEVKTYMKTIKVSDEVHRRLSDLGKKGDTFADVVEMLLLDYEARQKSGAKK